MDRRLLAATLFALAVPGLAAAPAPAATNIVLPRAGQVGLGIQAQGGTMLSSGDLGTEFGAGPGLVVSVRYRMRFERAVGLTFEAQRLDARTPSGRAGAFDSLTDAPATLRERLDCTTAGVEFYQLFDTRARTVKYLSAGLGLVQLSAHLSDGETQFPIQGDGFFVSAGAGLERFFFRSLAYDLGTRYQAIFHDGTVNHDVQLKVGLMFYAAY